VTMRSAILIATVLATTTGQALALCQDGPPFACTINGKQGTRQCVGGHITPCIVEGGGPSGSVEGTVLPKYFVLTVVYAPPGTQGGGSTSSVSYGSGSTTGTTTSTTKSYKGSYSITATVGAGILGNGGSVSASFGFTRNNSDTASLNITKTATSTIADTGPASDGIDHDHDLIYLWLNPSIDIKVNQATKSAAWTISRGTADIEYLYVGWLKHPDSMPPGVKSRLQHWNITAQDYPGIMKRDPFANGAASLSNRYQQLNTNFPYEPPLTANDPVPTYSFALSNSSTSTNTGTTEETYDVDLTIKTGASFIASVSLESDNKWEWTNASSSSTSSGSTQTASVTVGGPSFGYTGPTDMRVFYDRLYRSFLFVPIKESPGFKGKVSDRQGRPARWQEVTVTANGQKHRTFTDAQGEYRVFAKISGPVTIRSGGATLKLPTAQNEPPADIRLP